MCLVDFCRLFAAFRTLPGTSALPKIQLKRVRETECRSRHNESTYITTQRLQLNTPLADHDQDELYASTGRRATNVGTPVLRCKVEVVTSVRWCSCVRGRNSRMCLDTLFTSIGGSTFFRIISQNNSVQHTTIHSTFESCVPT